MHTVREFSSVKGPILGVMSSRTVCKFSTEDEPAARYLSAVVFRAPRQFDRKK
jgi:hypothetical protein